MLLSNVEGIAGNPYMTRGQPYAGSLKHTVGSNDPGASVSNVWSTEIYKGSIMIICDY